MKKALSFALAVLMLLGVSTAAFAKTYDEYTQSDISKTSANLLRIGFADATGVWDGTSAYNFGKEVAAVCDADAAEEYQFVDDSGSPLYIWAAANNDSSARSYSAKVTSKHIDRWDIEVESKGTGDIVKEINIDYSSGSAIIVAEVAPYLDSLSSVSFSVDIWLVSDGKKVRNTDYTLKGGFKHASVEIYEEDDELDLYDAMELVLDVKETVREALIHLNGEVDVTMRLLKGKKVYLRATSEVDDDDIDIMEKFGFDDIIKVYSVNAKSESTTVSLNGDGSYVYTVADSSSYGKNMKLTYLGTSDDDELPLVDYYLISPEKIELNSSSTTSSSRDQNEDEPLVDNYLPAIELPPVDDYMMNPNGGPAASVPSANSNYNPSTGR